MEMIKQVILINFVITIFSVNVESQITFPYKLTRTNHHQTCEEKVKVLDVKPSNCFWPNNTTLYPVLIEDFNYKEDLPNNWHFKLDWSGDDKAEEVQNNISNGLTWMECPEGGYNNVSVANGIGYLNWEQEMAYNKKSNPTAIAKDYYFDNCFKSIKLNFSDSINTQIKSDTLNKKKNEFKHLFGLDAGAFVPPYSLTGHKGEVNFHYLLNYKFLISDFNFGIAPLTNFGYFYKRYITLGLTTNIFKKISFHLMFGGGSAPTSKESFNFEGDGYKLNIKGMCFKTGLFLNLYNTNKHLIGIDFVIMQAIAELGPLIPPQSSGSGIPKTQTSTFPVSYLNISYSLIINQRKNINE